MPDIGNFSAPILTPEQAFPYLTGAAKTTDIAHIISQIAESQANTRAQQIKNQYLPDKEREDLLTTHLANQLSQAKVPYADRMEAAKLATEQAEAPYKNAMTGAIPSEIALRRAQTAGVPSEIALRLAQTQEAKKRANESPAYGVGGNVAQIQALSDMLNKNPQALSQLQAARKDNPIVNTLLESIENKSDNAGGRGLGVGGREQKLFESLVGRDNPQLQGDPNKVYEAANALAQGQTKLADGTQLNPLSPAALGSLDRITKYGSTARLINRGIQSNQAEAEIPVLNKYIDEPMDRYGTTYAGLSPQAVADSFKTDDASQDELGKFVGTQALSYESANLRNWLAGGEPGITAINELMKRSGQLVDIHFPRLTAKAKKSARNYIDEALREALKARQSVGINASQLRTSNPRSMVEAKSGVANAIGKTLSLKIPSFKNKQEFLAWKATLSPEQRAAAQAQLGGS